MRGIERMWHRVSVRLDRELIALAIKLGCVSVREYVELVIDLKNFKKGLK
jgi:hypothetical protein